MDGASPSTDPSNMTETAAELGPCCVYYFVPVKVKVEAEAGLIQRVFNYPVGIRVVNSFFFNHIKKSSQRIRSVAL